MACHYIMKIGIIDIEPKIFNTAYMLISRYHKRRGDTVEWWSPLTDSQFDVVYCSSLFDFTNKSEVPKWAICGGTGFDVTSRLSSCVEDCEYDYSIYPDCKTSFVWFSRGCNRKCPWCVVFHKEGEFRLVRRKQLNSKGRYITIMDNDFFANPEWKGVIMWLGGAPVDIQGINVRTITDEQCEALSHLRRWKNKQFKIAWDVPKEEKAVLSGIVKLRKYIRAYKLMCYVLVGYDSTEAEDLHRIETLRKCRIDPFVMPYNKKDPYQKNLARWVNRKAIFKSVKWEDYRQSVTIMTTLSK